MSDQPIKIEMDVRDYECDMEGIVNNAVYMNYLEHARHGFIKHKGFNFSELIQGGIRLVVTHIEADYLYSLHSGDKFYITTSVEKVSKLRFGFIQEIFKTEDNRPILKAKVVGTSLDANGKPKYFERLEKLFL